MSDEKGSTTVINHPESPWGCLAGALAIVLLCAAAFGVTIDGKRYALGCSCSEGSP